MSVEVLSWVLHNSGARLVDRLVLITIADSANRDGMSQISYAQMADGANVSEGAARRSVYALREKGCLIVERTGGGRGNWNEYTVVMDAQIARVRRSSAPDAATPGDVDVDETGPQGAEAPADEHAAHSAPEDAPRASGDDPVDTPEEGAQVARLPRRKGALNARGRRAEGARKARGRRAETAHATTPDQPVSGHIPSDPLLKEPPSAPEVDHDPDVGAGGPAPTEAGGSSLPTQALWLIARRELDDVERARPGQVQSKTGWLTAKRAALRDAGVVAELVAVADAHPELNDPEMLVAAWRNAGARAKRVDSARRLGENQALVDGLDESDVAGRAARDFDGDEDLVAVSVTAWREARAHVQQQGEPSP